MTSLRRLLPVFLAAAVVLAGPAALPAHAAPDYRGVVDITFPTAASSRYSNDYHAGRSGGRVHRGTDLFAAAGTRVRAARGGTVIWLPTYESGSAGFAVQILGDDGRTYAYYHLGRAGSRFRDAVSRKLSLGGRVSRGQYLGLLGDSGNAAGGTPHLHFEIHDNRVQDPYGTNRVNPYPSLRRAQGLPVGDPGPAAGPVVGAKTLRMGSRGPAVVMWQRKLNRTRTTSKLVTDGVFGPGTQSATITFQKSVGLGPEGLGVVGPKTRAKMRWALNAGAAGAVDAAPTNPAPAPKPPPRTKPAPVKRPNDVQTAGLLRLGDSGPEVKVWQRKLNRSGRVGRVVADGAFGPGTHNATVKFQKSVGLGPAGLGVVGPKTRAAMKRVLN